MGEKKKRLEVVEQAKAEQAQTGGPVTIGRLSATELQYVREIEQNKAEITQATDFLITTLRRQLMQNTQAEQQVKADLYARFKLAPDAKVQIDLQNGDLKLVPAAPPVEGEGSSETAE